MYKGVYGADKDVGRAAYGVDKDVGRGLLSGQGCG